MGAVEPGALTSTSARAVVANDRLASVGHKATVVGIAPHTPHCSLLAGRRVPPDRSRRCFEDG